MLTPKILYQAIFQRRSNFLWLVLIVIWLSHLIQVFVPETGFDAVWYHLPVVKAILENGGLIYLPDLYQSLNPLFADLFFLVGFWLAGELGAKIVAYVFALATIFISYQLARKFVSKNWSLLFVILISTFQVIAWQAASFYVDVAKAFFEVSSIFFLVKFQSSQSQKHLILAALFFSASLATKLFSLFLLPSYLLLVYFLSQARQVQNLMIFFLVSLILPMPFYAFSYFNTGQPFFSFVIHSQKLAEIGGSADYLIYLRERLRYLPTSIFSLTLAKDYVTFILITFLPLTYRYKKLLTHPKLFLLFFFAVSQYLLWWFLPPTSTRYALSGFIVLTLIYFVIFTYAIKRNRAYFWPILISMALAILINFAPRLLVNWRSLKFLLSQQTKAEYIEQFYDGYVDQKLKEWHFRTTLSN